MKLGRNPSVPDRRDLRAAAFMAPSMLWSPPARDWRRTADGKPIPPWETFGNLEYGCCTCAAIGHADQIVSAHTGEPRTVTRDLVLEAYDAISAWDRSRPNENDNGASMRDALKWFTARGIVEFYARVDETNDDELKAVMNMCPGSYLGLDLPVAWQRMTVWDSSPTGSQDPAFRRRSWGGHAITTAFYDRNRIHLPTWGRDQGMTWPGLLTYTSEAWLFWLKGWTRSGLTPSGFDVERLRAEARRLAA